MCCWGPPRLSDGLVLVQALQKWVVHQDLVELLELLEGVLVVLAGSLGENIHLEVGIGDLLLVVLLVWGSVLLSLPL